MWSSGLRGWRIGGHCETETPNRHPDLPRDSRRAPLLRRQDRLRGATRRGGQALLPFPSATLRQEPLRGHAEGTLRGQRAPFPWIGCPRRLGLVRSLSGGALGFRPWEFQRPRPAPLECHGAVGWNGTAYGRGGAVRNRAGAVRQLGRGTAPPRRAAGRGTGRRVRQADFGRLGNAGGGEGESRLSWQPVFGGQGRRCRHQAHVLHRRQQVLEGQSVLGVEQPSRHYHRPGLRGALRLLRPRP